MRRGQGEFLNIGRQGDANRLKELTSDAGGRGAQQEALAILLKLDLEVEIDGGIGVLRNPPNTTCQENGMLDRRGFDVGDTRPGAG